jgi:hypothetical protein
LQLLLHLAGRRAQKLRPPLLLLLLRHHRQPLLWEARLTVQRLQQQ